MPDIRVENLIPSRLWTVSEPSEDGARHTEIGRIVMTRGGLYEAFGDEPGARATMMDEDAIPFAVTGPSLGRHGMRRDAVDALVRAATARRAVGM